jgi:hypothetical protein
MLKHYLDKISELEFAERNLEIPKLVTLEKSSMNERGFLISTITLQALADFFAAEFIARSDFLQTFVVSHSNLLDQGKKGDMVTEAKTIFQTISFSECESIKSLYISSIKEIARGLQNEGMKEQIELSCVNKMENRIKKNNLYVEVAYQEITAAIKVQKPLLMLQPNINGVGVDLVELWNRFFKKP